MTELVSKDVLDPAALEHLRSVAHMSGNARFMARLIELFIEDTVERLDGLGAAVERQDPAALRALAHAIRGGAATLGAREVVHACSELEDNADEWTSADRRAGVKSVGTAFERARLALQGLHEVSS